MKNFFLNNKTVKNEFDLSILSAGKSMISYIENPTGTTNYTKEERIICVFYYLRQTIAKNDWYRIPEFRNFLNKYGNNCPYIPNDIKEAEVLSRNSKLSPAKFIKDWIKDKGPIQELIIDPQELMNTIEILPKIKNSFLNQNLHDNNYFFSKYTEWHISCLYQQKFSAKKIVDIGAAYDGFSQTILAHDPTVEVTMVDLNFPKGLTRAHSRIQKLGSDAADMDLIETNSIDLVCMHNAFEHFDGDSDIGCLKEVSRILRSGGIALISPFFFSGSNSITINPTACFLFESSDYFKRVVRKELLENKTRVDFNHEIISPFARRYDMASLSTRILSSVPELNVKLIKCSFNENAILQKYSLKGHPSISIDPQLYNRNYFYFLELLKK